MRRTLVLHNIVRHCEAAEAICVIKFKLFEVLRTDCFVTRNDAELGRFVLRDAEQRSERTRVRRKERSEML